MTHPTPKHPKAGEHHAIGVDLAKKFFSGALDKALRPGYYGTLSLCLHIQDGQLNHTEEITKRTSKPPKH